MWHIPQRSAINSTLTLKQVTLIFAYFGNLKGISSVLLQLMSSYRAKHTPKKCDLKGETARVIMSHLWAFLFHNVLRM